MILIVIAVNSIDLKQEDRIILNTRDYLATSRQVELSQQKSGDAKMEKPKLLFEQIQNLFNLFKTRPKFGPESCEDCINIMSQLRPMEYYFESMDSQLEGTGIANGLNGSRPDYPIELETNNDEEFAHQGKDSMDPHDRNLDETESDLSNYHAKLRDYLDEHPVERDKNVFYSKGKCLFVTLNNR